MSDNWIVQNLENALETWNEKLAEIWQLITQSPEQFKGGTIWNVIVGIHGAVQAIGLALLVLFFVVGVMKTCGSFAELKRPEHALKVFIRFALAKAAVTYGLELMIALFNIVQGLISTIMNAAGFGVAQETVLPAEIVTAVEDCGFFESIPLWAVTLIGGLFITVLSFIMIMTVYGRFFKLYLYTAIAPVPLSAFAGEPSQNIGKSFIKSYVQENCDLALSDNCVIYGHHMNNGTMFADLCKYESEDFYQEHKWCACFVSWCANECGYIDAGVIPKFAGCVWGVEWFRDRGLWQDNSYEPRPGDIIFFDWDNKGSSGPQDGESDHVGIVEKVENGTVYTVEGNSGDSCRENHYAIGYYEILGYGMPQY